MDIFYDSDWHIHSEAYDCEVERKEKSVELTALYYDYIKNNEACFTD